MDTPVGMAPEARYMLHFIAERYSQRGFDGAFMYRSAMVSRTRCPPKEKRIEALENAEYNVFNLDAADVYIDLLTDSGTGTMSTEQWAALLQGDESYAGSESFADLEAAVSEIMGFEQLVPAHQGRGAEHLLYGALVDEGDYVIANTHFDTTRAHVAEAGGKPLDCPVAGAWQLDSEGQFKGNLDIEGAREQATAVGAENIPLIILTLTNNSAAGQPVSIANVRDARQLADELDARLIVDACRFAENAWFVKNREEGWAEESIESIVQAELSPADALIMSGKKDGLVNIGGFVALSQDETELYEQLRERAILYEGFPTYGGMAGRDMAAMAVGLREAVDPAYLDHRISQVGELADRIEAVGVPVYRPPGGHAVYVDASRTLPEIPPDKFPGQALVCALYREGGVRAVELGSFAFPETDRPELVRLSVPRRSYHREHLEHIAESFEKIVDARDSIQGLEIVSEPSRKELRHFSASLTPV